MVLSITRGMPASWATAATRLNIEHVHARVGDGLAVERAGFGRDGLAEILGIIRLDEFHVDAEAAETHVELRVGAAVKRTGCHQFIARSHEARNRQKLRRLPAGSGQGRHAALERRHALLENVGGGIHDARIDVAELLQRKQGGGMFGIVENERGGLVNRHGARVAGRIGRVPGVQGTGGES